MSVDVSIPVETPTRSVNLLTTERGRIVLGLFAITVLGIAAVYLFGGKDSNLVTQTVVTGLLLGGVYVLVSLGLTLIFGVLGIVNFAQGAMLAMAMYLVYFMVSSAGINPYLAVVLSAPIMFGFGWLVQSTLMNRLITDVGHSRPLLVTLGLSLLISNTLLMIFGGRPLNVPSPYAGSVQILGAIADVPRIIAFVGAVIVAGGLIVILRKSPVGLAIRAVAANGTGASLVGVNVKRIYAMTFGLGAASVGVAGGLLAPFTSLVPSAGDQFTTLAFVIVVLGGLGSVPGALVGGIFIGLLQTVGSLFLPGSGPLLLVFGMFVLVLFLRPQGLFGANK
ncbi:branched-chain amino acid ABC transporter permease [Cryobacterium levicorallinum]|uniref:Branched-chain amino acid ABC transporter permease n=1 Tax=Cryobacterium levicorallinum TaxID=995038 RepID=A0A4R8VHA5_9MICO|nr:branched-chain amino acid ABC transporter permease [Cryobacterium levicorallinum]TFB82431.1 branched-chain amino acid ABC transporter permease [Cryobacterium levicorallinum]